VPLDIVFVFDTTGSMGEEIERLKTTIEIINLNLTSMAARPKVRFGMVLYKDTGDSYRTKVVPLTDDLYGFQRELNRVTAGGGGDYPEDLEAALADLFTSIDWNPDGIRLAFIITDAPPQLRADTYTYADAVHDARELGVKIFSVGTGGLDSAGEYALRQIAQYTYGKYIFLTYGESGESEGGAPGSVSHHTGANYQTDKLEAIIIRLAREELSHLTDVSVQDDEDYFRASEVAEGQRSETLAKLFEMALGQLVDYSSYGIDPGTPAAALPIVPNPESLKLDAEYFGDALTDALARNGSFRMVERRDLQRILAELELQLSGLADEANAARVGRLLGAELLVSGSLYRRSEGFELFIRLVRVESGEILAVAKAVIAPGLGISS
jgi:hypothetical protein